MAVAATLSPSQFAGTFELSEDGTVLYSRTPLAADEAVGQNFFEDIYGFDDILELRKKFDRFVDSRRAADCVEFSYRVGGRQVKTKILLTRAFNVEYCPPTNIVMLQIMSGS